MKIFLSLAQDGERPVSTLRDLPRQSRPAVSHPLTRMRMTGLGAFRGDGKPNDYRLESSTRGDLTGVHGYW